MKYILIYLSLFLISCNQRQESERENIDTELAKLDSARGDFRADYFNDPEHAHKAFKIAYNGIAFNIVPGSETIRPGNPPFSANDKSGPYLISFRDVSGKTVFSYSLEHPGVLRACEGEKPETHQKDTFTFEVLAPAKLEVASIAITGKGKTIFESRVPPKPTGNDTIRVQ